MEPIAHRYELACRPEHAFAVFTERISEWWPPAARTARRDGPDGP